MIRSSKLLFVLLLAGAASGAFAQQTYRANNWEASIQLIGTSSEKFNGAGGSSLDVDSDIGLGAGFTYNFSQHLALGFDMLWARPDYKSVFVTEEGEAVSVKHTMNIFNGQFNGTWNILKGPITPYLQAGLGWTYVDSNVADGPPTTGCWWDPWWGYICRNYYSTYSDTNFSYGVGAGLRWEFGNGMFLKGSYNRLEIDGSNGINPNFDTAKLELGWIFR
jgi:opacity protein-like surface antigen